MPLSGCHSYRKCSKCARAQISLAACVYAINHRVPRLHMILQFFQIEPRCPPGNVCCWRNGGAVAPCAAISHRGKCAVCASEINFLSNALHSELVMRSIQTRLCVYVCILMEYIPCWAEQALAVRPCEHRQKTRACVPSHHVPAQTNRRGGAKQLLSLSQPAHTPRALHTHTHTAQCKNSLYNCKANNK